MAQQSNAIISNLPKGGEKQSNGSIEHWQTVSGALEAKAKKELYSKGDPCSNKGTLGEINMNLHKMFEILRGVQKYGNFYINGAINKVENLRSEITAITSAIAGVLKTLVQRLRNWVLNKLKKLIYDALDFILTKFFKKIKESIVAGIIDQIFCAFEKIIVGLIKLVGDFLYSLIGQVIQTPFCATEKWTNALINRLVNDIDNALAPIFDSINDILSGVGNIFGSVSQAIDFILGFQGFLCGGPECPEIIQFKLEGWGGPSASEQDDFNNFNFGLTGVASSITNQADAWMNDFFGPDGNQTVSPGECYTGEFECGIPQVVIFGGGGSGAVAQAVVNQVGQVIGTNLLDGGSGYTSPPFVQIVDPAGCGSDASAFAVMGTDDDGNTTDSISYISLNNVGSDYNSTYNGGAPVIPTFYGAPNPLTVNNSVTLNWNVTNADKVSLVGYSGFNNLPLTGSATIAVMEDDVSFAAGETTTTKTFTLKAEKTNNNSQPQITEKTFILTVTQEQQVDTTANSNAPVINSFTASNTNVSPGDLVLLSWDTDYAEEVSLSGDDENDSLPTSGSVTTVIPQAEDLEFPSDGSGIELTYTLTAQNDNGISTQNSNSVVQTATQSITITVSPASSTPSSDSDDVDDDIQDDGSDTDNSGSTTSGGSTTGSDTTTTSGGDGGDGTGGTSGTGNNDAVAEIDSVDIISTGIGYTSGDTVTLDDGVGGSFSIDVNQIGQVVGFNVLETGYGYTTVPNINISGNSGGLGAQFRVNLRFIPINEFLENEKNLVVDPNKLVQVVDCVGKRIPSQSINT